MIWLVTTVAISSLITRLQNIATSALEKSFLPSFLVHLTVKGAASGFSLQAEDMGDCREETEEAFVAVQTRNLIQNLISCSVLSGCIPKRGILVFPPSAGSIMLERQQKAR